MRASPPRYAPAAWQRSEAGATPSIVALGLRLHRTCHRIRLSVYHGGSPALPRLSCPAPSHHVAGLRGGFLFRVFCRRHGARSARLAMLSVRDRDHEIHGGAQPNRRRVQRDLPGIARLLVPRSHRNGDYREHPGCYPGIPHCRPAHFPFRRCHASTPMIVLPS